MERVNRFENRPMGRTPKSFAHIVVSIALGVGGAMTQEAAAQDNNCAEVIRMSRQTQRVIQNSEHVQSHARNFCQEYSKSDSSSRSRNYSASLDFLSGSMSGGRTSESEVASKYCSADAGSSERSDAYDQYLTTFPPGTFDAYQACIAYSNRQIRIRLEYLLERQMNVVVVSTMDGGGVTMDLAPSDGITCRRTGLNSNDQLAWEQPRGTSIVDCRRETSAQEGRVTLYSPDIPNSSLTLPWSRYNEEGAPVDSLRALQEKLVVTNASIDSLETRLALLENRTVGFGEPKKMDFDKVHPAPSAGIVTATVMATGGGPRSHICGWAASDRESLASKEARKRNALALAHDTVHYSGAGTNVSGAGISMPVREGEFWIVTQCGGGPQNVEIATYFHPLGER